MVFSSVPFLFYFLPLVLIIYYCSFFSKGLKNSVLLIFSLFFYAFGEPKFVLLMILSILVNYFLGLLIDRFKSNHSKAKLILIIALIYNLGMLFVFKYLTFFLENFNIYPKVMVHVPKIVLPIGISFFTFQALSYVIDVYRGDAKVQKSLLNIGLYISFFPQLVAGPIVRYTTIEEQINNRTETFTKFSVGTCRFIVGLSKKVLISNTMAIIVDHAFSMSSIAPISTSYAWLGAIAYTLQIYFDFSGYSDMAIGLGLMFGFKFDENFNYPYISKSISEFWRRWHISLGTWFKDYVYFPLGGSRVRNKDKMIKNLFIVWILTGIWHGAEWTFLVWGLWHFTLIAFEKVTNFHRSNKHPILRTIYVLFVVVIGWVIFRSPNLKEAGTYLGSMFGLNGAPLWSKETIMFLREYGIYLALGILFSTPIANRVNKKLASRVKLSSVIDFIYPIVLMILFFICVTNLVKSVYNPFIYFNF